MNQNIVRLELPKPVMEVRPEGLRHIKSGKVREIFDAGNHFLIAATDRISAFDCIMPNGIPGKGHVLTAISAFWFEFLKDVVPNHLVAWRKEDFSAILQPNADLLDGRSMEVVKCKPLPIECVVRGYLAGSGWKEYTASGTVCGESVPHGLLNGSRIGNPIFTPATKAETGHDENISYEKASTLMDPKILAKVRDLSLTIYSKAHDYLQSKGLILADTKFEFGIHEGEIILIDEVITPDSSRLWPSHCHKPGATFQYGFDKQIVRNFLETQPWDKTPPAPALPDHLVIEVAQAYDFIHRLITE